MFRKHHLHLHVIFIHEKNIVYTYLFLIMLITLITSGSLNDAFVLNANDMPIKVMFIWTFWYLIFIFLSSYELVMNFQSFGQTVKGHSRDHDGKSKGKTEQARKVRAKPMGRNQLGVKMQLSQKDNFRCGMLPSIILITYLIMAWILRYEWFKAIVYHLT